MAKVSCTTVPRSRYKKPERGPCICQKSRVAPIRAPQPSVFLLDEGETRESFVSSVPTSSSFSSLVLLLLVLREIQRSFNHMNLNKYQVPSNKVKIRDTLQLPTVTGRRAPSVAVEGTRRILHFFLRSIVNLQIINIRYHNGHKGSPART